MDSTQGALHFQATLDYTQLRQGVDAIRRDIMGLNNSVQEQTNRMDSAFKNLAIGIGSYFSAQALFGFTKELINVRGEFQKTEIAFSTMLGSQEKAQALMGDMVKLAASTPFSLQEVSAGAKQLLAFQVPANQVVDTLTRMGNIAAGLGVPLERINLVYGQVKAKGRLMGDDLRQFTEAGIPMIHELAKNFNVTDSAISKMVTDGKIGFSDVQKVLNNLTNEGGMFYNLMEKQSQSLSGKVSNLGDAFSQMLNKIGESNQGFLSGGIDALASLVTHYQDVINIVSTLVSTYGAYRAAMMAANAINEASVFIEGTKAAMDFAQGISGMTRAQLLLNAAMEINPVMLMAGALAAVVGAIVYFKTEADEAKNSAEQMAQAVNAATASVGKESSELNNLYSTATNDNKARKERLDAVKKLQSLYPSYFSNLSAETIMTGKASAAYYDLRDAIVASARARAIESELQKRESDRLARDAKSQSEMDAILKRYKENGYKDTDISLGTGTGATYTSTADQQRKIDQQAYFRLLQEKQKNHQKDLEEDKFYLDEKENLSKKAAKYDKDIAKNQQGMEPKSSGWAAGIKDQIKAIDAQMDSAPNQQVYMKLEARKKKLEELLKPPKPKKEKTDALQEVVSADSIIALERRVENWNAALQRVHDGKVDVLTQDKYGKQVKTGETISLQDAKNRMREDQAKLDAARKEIKNQSFDEELAETKRQIELRDKYIQSGYNKEAADKIFKVGDKSYIQYLNETADSLDKLMRSGKGGDETLTNLEKIREAIRSYNGEKTFADNLAEKIENLKSKFSGLDLISQLEKLQKTSMPIGEGGETEDQKNQRKTAVQKAIDDERKAQEQKYRDLLKDQESFEQKSADLKKRYDAIRATSGYQNGSDADKAKVDASFSKEATDLFFNEMSKSDQWTQMFTDMNKVATSKLTEFRGILVAKLKDAKSAEEKIKIGEFIQKIDATLRANNPFKALKNAIADLGNTSLTTEQRMAALQNAVAATDAVLDQMNQIVEGARDIFNSLGISGDSALGDIVNNIQQTIGGLKQMTDGIGEFAKSWTDGNVLGMVSGAIKAIGGAIKAVSGWINGDNKKERRIKSWANEVANLKTQYDQLDKAVSKALGDDKYTSQENVIANLRQQSQVLQKMLSTEQSKKKSDQSKINDYKSQIQSINQQIDEIQNNIVKNVLQTDAQDAAGKLGDALVNAFSKGEDASKAMRDTANSMIQDIVKNALKMRMEKALQPVMNNLLSQLGFNSDGTGSFKGLSPDQIEVFKTQIAAIGQQQQGFLDAYQQLFQGTDSSSAQGLKADIKGVTEKTAGALEAQINAMRINQVSGLEAMRASLLQLSQIEVNTRPIIQIQKDISELNTKFSKNGLKAIGIG